MMKPLHLFLLALLPTWFLGSVTAADATALPRVLILGDSISMAYTPVVRSALKKEAVVFRPMLKDNPKKAENCAGTTKGVQALPRWLKIDGGHWDVIHFNFGLHDLKRVDPKTSAPSNDHNHFQQASPEVYERQLRKIVMELKKTGALLIYATTTPVPEGNMRPHRDIKDVILYNEIARRIMKEADIDIDDLYGFALPQLNSIQRPANVHFTKNGTRALAGEVTRHIRIALAKK